MKGLPYSVRIGESLCIADDVSYEALLRHIIEFTARAAMARSIDENDWEHEQLRRHGLSVLQIFRNGKAVWTDPQGFESELTEARRERVEQRFNDRNELDPDLYVKLDKDLRKTLCVAGYKVPSLLTNMKKLFVELERDAADHAAGAREGLVADILKAAPPQLD
jgi:hypothetical protein